MSLKELCDRTLSHVQNKHRFFLTFFFNLYLNKLKKDIVIVFILIRI